MLLMPSAQRVVAETAKNREHPMLGGKIPPDSLKRARYKGLDGDVGFNSS
jgi:hypothetical protein